MRRPEAQAIYRAGEEAVVRVLLEMAARADVAEQRATDLQTQVHHLQERLAKNSRNSSKPPSTDGLNKPQPKSLRPTSKRRSGGQPGPPGRTLAPVDEPDQIERHRVERCEECHRCLAQRPTDGLEKRQVHELPSLRLIVTEHQAEIKHCSCGHTNTAAFPEGVNAPVQYGPAVRATAVYLKSYQLLPYERTCELLGDLFDCPISEGTLATFIGDGQARLQAPVQQIKEQIAQAQVAQFDESGSRVQRQLWWLHAASTTTATYYEIHPKRGSEALEAIGILPTFIGRAIHDCWKPYFAYDCAHGLCNAHHLRELIFAHEQHQQHWAAMMSGCLLDIKAAVAHARLTTDQLTAPQLRSFEARYQSLLDQGHAECPAAPATGRNSRRRAKQTKSRNLLERLDAHRHQVLAFMYDFNVPFDNNLAERDIRMIKVQQKISGTFRSVAGAQAFCCIRSYLATARKNAVGALDAITRAFAGNPFVPTANTT